MIDELPPREAILAEIAWEISERLLQGEDPQLEEYTHHYPELEEDIHQLLMIQKGVKDAADRARYRISVPQIKPE